MNEKMMIILYEFLIACLFFVSFQSGKYMIITALLIFLIPNIVSCRSAKKIKATNRIEDIDFEAEGLDQRYKPCLNDEDINELCERCMRIAQVEGDDLFAMCCVNEDEAQDFCRNYVFYGIT